MLSHPLFLEDDAADRTRRLRDEAATRRLAQAAAPRPPGRRWFRSAPPARSFAGVRERCQPLAPFRHPDGVAGVGHATK